MNIGDNELCSKSDSVSGIRSEFLNDECPLHMRDHGIDRHG